MHNQYHQLTIDRTKALEHSSIILSRLEATCTYWYKCFKTLPTAMFIYMNIICASFKNNRTIKPICRANDLNISLENIYKLPYLDYLCVRVL